MNKEQILLKKLKKVVGDLDYINRAIDVNENRNILEKDITKVEKWLRNSTSAIWIYLITFSYMFVTSFFVILTMVFGTNRIYYPLENFFLQSGIVSLFLFAGIGVLSMITTNFFRE